MLTLEGLFKVATYELYVLTNVVTEWPLVLLIASGQGGGNSLEAGHSVIVCIELVDILVA